MSWSDDAVLLRHPFQRYAALGAEDASWRSVALRLGRLLLVLALFISITTSGRVVLSQVVGSTFMWIFTPLVQAGAVLFAARLVARRVPAMRVLDLYFAGHGPWLLLMWV